MAESIALETVKLSPPIAWAFRHYKALAEEGKVGRNHVRLPDYRRWSLVYDMIPDGVSLIDVGIGAGQFVNAASKSQRFESVIGLDYKATAGLHIVSQHWLFAMQSITSARIPRQLTAQIVTCMECIEHLDNPGFSVAVANLKKMATERLIVTVPFEEPQPLPHYHKQRFDMDRLNGLFPQSNITLVTWADRPLWAVVDCNTSIAHASKIS